MPGVGESGCVGEREGWGGGGAWVIYSILGRFIYGRGWFFGF